MTADPTQASAADSDADDSAHAPPRLRRVQIRNYKSIAFCDVSLAPLTILVGRNGAGKSNFLDALSFLRDVLSDGLGKALQARGGWDSIYHRGATDGFVSLELDLELTAMPLSSPTGSRASNSIGNRKQGTPRPTRLERVDVTYQIVVDVEKEGGAGAIFEWGRFSWSGGARFEFQPVAGQIFGTTHEAANGIPNDFVTIAAPDRSALNSMLWMDAVRATSDALRRMEFYSFEPSVIRLPQPKNRGWFMARSGANVASVIETTRAIDPAGARRISSYVAAVVPEVEKIEVLPTVGGYETVRFHVRSGEEDGSLLREFDSAAMSDGTLRTLAAAAAVFQSRPGSGAPSLVAIEEPETSLHPAAMRALAAAFDEGTLRTQILVTTHSPDLLDCEAIQPENIRVVEFVEGATSITGLDEASVSIVKDHINTLGGLERDRHLELNLVDLERQTALAAARKPTT